MRFEVHGAGQWLFLGPPLRATITDATGAQRNALLNAYVEALADSYRIVVLDYPPTGNDAERAAEAFTPERVCADILDVADRVGADQFAWYGYSWGGVVGLQLAAASSRVSALVCGGWPLLSAPYADLIGWGELQYTKTKLPDWKLTRAFYSPLLTRSEREIVSRIKCPRMAFAGAADIVESNGYIFPVGPLLAKHGPELEETGWTVRLIEGQKHDLYLHADIVVPLVREFFDGAALPAGRATAL